MFLPCRFACIIHSFILGVTYMYSRLHSLPPNTRANHTTLRSHFLSLVILKARVYLYGYGLGYGMRYGVRQKLCVSTKLTRNGIRNCVRFLVVFMHIEGCAFPSRSPCIIHGTSSFETIVGRLFEGRRSAVIIRTLVVESNVFSDQYYELLCFGPCDFADLRHGWITRAFSPARRK